VGQHAIFQVVAQAAGQHGLFDVLAIAHHVFRRVGVIDADHVLFDDGALVEFFGDVMAGGADQLDAAFVGLMVGPGADETGQETVVDVDDPTRIVAAQFGRQDLHVARQHHGVAV
jgi:hypothetical protein